MGKLTLTQWELQERQRLNCTACVRQIQYGHAAKSPRILIAREDARNQVPKGSKKEDCRSRAPTGPEPFQSAVRCPPRQSQSAFKLCLIEKTFFFFQQKENKNKQNLCICSLCLFGFETLNTEIQESFEICDQPCNCSSVPLNAGSSFSSHLSYLFLE